MSSQIFKKPIPDELFFNLLNDIAFKIDNYYTSISQKRCFDINMHKFVWCCTAS